MGRLAGGCIVIFYSNLSITGHFARISRNPFFVVSPAAMPGLLWEQVDAAFRQIPLLVAVALPGMVLALRERSPIGRLLIINLIIQTGVILTVYGWYRSYYLVHIIPLLVLLAALFVRRVEQSVGGAGVAGWAVVLVAGSAGLIGWGLNSSLATGHNQAMAVAERVRTVVSPDARLVSINPMYIGLSDYRGFIEMNTGAMVAGQTGQTEAEVWAALDPEVVILAHDYPITPPQTLLDYVASRGMGLAGCWQGDVIGRVDLYAVNTGSSTALENCERIES